MGQRLEMVQNPANLSGYLKQRLLAKAFCFGVYMLGPKSQGSFSDGKNLSNRLEKFEKQKMRWFVLPVVSDDENTKKEITRQTCSP